MPHSPLDQRIFKETCTASLGTDFGKVAVSRTAANNYFFKKQGLCRGDSGSEGEHSAVFVNNLPIGHGGIAELGSFHFCERKIGSFQTSGT